MKDLSLILLKNTWGAKMRKGFKQFCNGDGSTSTLNQQKMGSRGYSANIDSPYYLDAGSCSRERQPTLEEMILQLELEEAAASRRAKVDEYQHHRMSCVNSSDILRSARNALNQYPRFSLDGKDAMYRSSFRNMVPARGLYGNNAACFDSQVQKLRRGEELLPATIGGESVVWRSPGVVAKLMGLEAIPIPVERYRSKTRLKILSKRAGKLDEKIEWRRRSVPTDNNDACSSTIRRPAAAACCSSSSSKAGYCVMKPLCHGGVELPNQQFGWPIRGLRPQNATLPHPC